MPKIQNQQLGRYITFRVNETDLEKLEAVSKKKQVSRSEVIRQILKVWDDGQKAA
ncbi:hypothetical protein NIES970_30000 (plasmid) [[Synechococcus] sp. NIES-970]|nr:hypothetical protein NIES970_30000 [[Synechococcus] sp. NIES-970]